MMIIEENRGDVKRFAGRPQKRLFQNGARKAAFDAYERADAETEAICSFDQFVCGSHLGAQHTAEIFRGREALLKGDEAEETRFRRAVCPLSRFDTARVF